MYIEIRSDAKTLKISTYPKSYNTNILTRKTILLNLQKLNKILKSVFYLHENKIAYNIVQ
jgi:hypothetical protein